jgi:uncharacterized membrane protein YciS (DUF1049 family)
MRKTIITFSFLEAKCMQNGSSFASFCFEVGCALTFALEAKFEIEAKISFCFEAKKKPDFT